MFRGERELEIIKKKTLKTWDFIDKFKELCRSKGWNAYENDDVIEAENEYHKFIWVNHLHVNTFKRVVMNPLCPIREGNSYRMVRLSCMAWVLSETPPMSIWQTVKEAPSLSRRVALYDLSSAYEEKPTCSKLNGTQSVVLQEFERFLNVECGIKLTPSKPRGNQEDASLRVLC